MKTPSYQWREISLTESYKLRALAILMIIIHNFLHLTAGAPGENEFYYSHETYRNFINGLWNTPTDFVKLLFSYLGHYGVQVFFFLSGYGAALKFSNSSSPPLWWSYVKQRLFSIYPAVFIAALGMFIYYSYNYGFIQTIEDDAANLFRQMFGVANFTTDKIFKPIGPWWFIGVIVQFYLIAPLIYKLPLMNTNKRPVILGIIALGSLSAEYFFGSAFKNLTNCGFNLCILGHLDICALGMLGAHYKKLTIPLWVFTIALILFTVGNWNASMWVATAFWMTILLIPLLRIIAQKISNMELGNKTLLYLGQTSIYIFLCNGYLRRPLLDYPEADPIWWKAIVFCFIFILFVILWASGSYWLEQKIRTKLSKNISAGNE